MQLSKDTVPFPCLIFCLLLTIYVTADAKALAALFLQVTVYPLASADWFKAGTKINFSHPQLLIIVMPEDRGADLEIGYTVRGRDLIQEAKKCSRWWEEKKEEEREMGKEEEGKKEGGEEEREAG